MLDYSYIVRIYWVCELPELETTVIVNLYIIYFKPLKYFIFRKVTFEQNDIGHNTAGPKLI